MEVFVTGATGYIGGAVASALLEHGHRITGLARSAETAEALSRRGIGAVSGSLDDVQPWASACGTADAVVHLAFQWKPNVAATIDAERRVVETMLAAAGNAGKPFLFTSGTSVLGDTGAIIRDEADAIPPHPLDERLATERLVMEAEGVRGVVIRAPNVYGDGDGEALLAALRRAGSGMEAIPYAAGTAGHLWSFVHVDDLAALFVLALEKAPPRQLFHAGAQSGLRTREIAQALSHGMGWEGRTREIPFDELWLLFPVAALADYWSQNGQSWRTRAEQKLGWRPIHLNMLEEIARPLGR